VEEGGASGLAGASMDPASELAFRLRAMPAGERAGSRLWEPDFDNTGL